MASVMPMLESSGLYKEFAAADWASDLDLGKAYPGWTSGRPVKLPREIIYTGGALSTKLEQGSTVILNAAWAGVPLARSPRWINNTDTDATAVHVAW